MDWKTIKNWCEAKRLAIRQWIAARDTDGKIVAVLWESAAYAAVAAFVLGLFLGAEKFRDIALAMAAILGFPLLFQRTRAASQQAETDSRRRMAEAYSQAAALFGKTALSLRLAGLYALWKIAEEDTENHHIQIMRILCAFVRNPMPLENWEPIEADLSTTIRPDLEAVMNLLGNRNENQRARESAVNYKMDFKGANLQNFYLRVGDWRFASFVGADLRGVEFDISDMRGAQFTSANLGMTSFHTVDLRQASFLFVEIDENTTFDGAAMNGATLNGIRGDRSVLENGVILTKDGEIMHSEESSQGNEHTAKMQRRDIQEWEEKRRQIAKPLISKRYLPNLSAF